MSVLLQPLSLLCIILIGYLLKRFGLFGSQDYRVIQKAEFNVVLPGAIVFSFATNPHDISLLWVLAFGFIVAFIPPMFVFFCTRHTPISRRAFLMLNSSGYNIGCFSFPILQSLIGPIALVPAAMFDVGNCIMVAAGTNVMTQTLLHIEPNTTQNDIQTNTAATLPYQKPTDRDARRLARHALGRRILNGFVSSVSFDVYIVMIVLMLLNVQLPHWVASLTQPFSAANALCAMLMVGMLTELPSSKHDVIAVLQVLLARIPWSIIFAAAAWFFLPFDATIRQAVALCCFAPTAVFAIMFTDKMLGNAKLAGFTLALTAFISMITMTGLHFLLTL